MRHRGLGSADMITNAFSTDFCFSNNRRFGVIHFLKNFYRIFMTDVFSTVLRVWCVNKISTFSQGVMVQRTKCHALIVQIPAVFFFFFLQHSWWISINFRLFHHVTKMNVFFVSILRSTYSSINRSIRWSKKIEKFWIFHYFYRVVWYFLWFQ